MARGRPKGSTNKKLPYQTGLVTTTVTEEQAKKYGIRLVDGRVDNLKLEEVEWFSDSCSAKNPTIGFTKSGQINISKETAALMSIEEGDHLEIGFQNSPRRLLIKKSTVGLLPKKLAGGKAGSGFRCQSSKIIKWMTLKKMPIVRYVVEKTDNPDIFVLSN